MRAAAAELELHRHELVQRSAELVYERLPELEAAYGPAGRLRCLEDSAFHLRFLRAAVLVEEAEIFADYARWTAALLARFGIPASHLVESFRALGAAVGELAPLAADDAGRMLDAGEAALAL